MNGQGFWALLRLDALVTVRHRLIHVVVALATGFGVLIGFVLPDELVLERSEWVVDDTTDARLAGLTSLLAADSVYADEASLRAALEDNADAVGILFEGTAEMPRARVIRQGHEDSRQIALMQTVADATWAEVGGLGREPLHHKSVLAPGMSKPRFGEAFIPVLFALDVCLLGFIFGAVMMLQEKQSGTIMYFRITPGTVASYIGAKLVVNVALVALNVLVLVGLGAPALLASLWLFPLVLLAGAGMTLLGLGLAVYFRDLSSFFYAMAAVGLVTAIPLYPFFSPSLELGWTVWLPTHHVLFGTYAACFGGPAEVVHAGLLWLAGFVICAASLAGFAIKTRLIQEAH